MKTLLPVRASCGAKKHNQKENIIHWITLNANSLFRVSDRFRVETEANFTNKKTKKQKNKNKKGGQSAAVKLRQEART